MIILNIKTNYYDKNPIVTLSNFKLFLSGSETILKAGRAENNLEFGINLVCRINKILMKYK